VTDSPEETLALARTAAGAVRSLNHAPLGGQGLAQPADAYPVPGELTPAAAVGGARLHLTGARASAAALAGGLGSARQQIAAVHGTPAREEGEHS
jgi:hypothetical protein